MRDVLWLAGADVEATGVCQIECAEQIVEEAFRLFDAGQAVIAPESALRLHGAGRDRACYSLPAYVGGEINACGVKWTSHGEAAEAGRSRIQAAVVLNAGDGGAPMAVLNGTEIGAARTGAVTALALRCLAPKSTRKVALCGAGGQAERQLQAVLHALPRLEAVSIWSRGNVRSQELSARYQGYPGADVQPARTLEEAVEGADVVISATSADTPYLEARHLRSASLYCHIGFHEITWEALEQFDRIIVDTWDEAKDVSGQSLFRYYREGRFQPSRITGTLGAVLSGRLEAPAGTPARKVMFDAFGLPIFDLCLAREAYLRVRELGLGTPLPW